MLLEFDSLSRIWWEFCDPIFYVSKYLRPTIQFFCLRASNIIGISIPIILEERLNVYK